MTHRPSDSRRARFRDACAAGGVERVVQALVGVLLAAFAVDSLAQPLVAILAGAGAAVLIVGAIRGWCPGALLAHRAAAEPNRLGIPEARDSLQRD
ncbi:YgaP-like transmembrane domain [Agrococcus sp. KRD186]|jgi:hypothetical protein|uniref:YgaP-like transmembrane domain n=1 Tax=Agrococcus sp. KRD186 TaxID=2729730 RepID=UPI0019D125DD|nr:DUF2892 domain-containing protein [Agrococcus sp. KRD186]